MLLSRKIFKPLSAQIRNHQVTVVGGASDVGQILCLLLRAERSITKLHVHDTRQYTPGIYLDLSHVPSESAIKGFTGEDTLDRALKDSDLVIAVGGVIRKPGITNKSWLSTNTEFVKSLASKIARVSPMPHVGIVTQPINSMVPMAAEIMRNGGNFDAKKLFGVTEIDALRAQSLYASDNNLNPRDCTVPVIGGHSDKTMIPLLSQTKPRLELNEKAIQELTTKIRKCDEIVTRAKKGWSPTLSVAYSVLIFTRAILNALDGKPAKVNALVENNDFGTSFFSGLVTVNEKGAGEMERYTDLSQYECHLLERSIAQLRKDVMRGKKFLELA